MAQVFGTGHRVLVTGGSGFIGSHLCDALVRRGVHVVAVDNFITGSPRNVEQLAGNAQFHLVTADVVDGLPEGPFDAILHFASPASPPIYQQKPVETLQAGSYAVFHCLDLARAHGARFLLASTSECYGDPKVHPQPEDYWGNVNPVGPRAMYDEAKRFAEAATSTYRRSFDVNTAIVRIFNTYGPRMNADDGRAIPNFITQALTGNPITIYGDGQQTRSICYVDDLVSGILALLDSDEAGPINLGTEHEMTMGELAGMIVELTGSRSQVIHVPRPVDDPQVRRPDLTLARRLLNYEPAVTPKEGLRRTVEYFSASGAAASSLSERPNG